jgi:hypothetical protein
MDSAMIPVYGAATERCLAIESDRLDEERRIRRGMRLDPKAWAKTAKRPPQLLRGALLLTGGFCLGWEAFRFWRN